MAGSNSVSIIFNLVMLYLLHGYCTLSEGGDFSSEYSRMKAYVKQMTKHTIMSIKTEYGDVYDCVDIYKQPAFDHPLLKNHTLQIEPSSYPKGVGRNNNNHEVQSIGLSGGGCPNGTVPIHRRRKDDILQSHSDLGFHPKDNAFHQYAGVRTADGRDGVYYGSRGFLNVWNPKVHNALDYSLAQVSLKAGPISGFNAIKAGWMVNPRLYGDSRTRLFTLWTADAYKKTGCFNIKCPGFVQVNRNIPVDGAVDWISVYKGQQNHIQIDFLKDGKTGNWFLFVDSKTVGYWPPYIFNYLNTKAERANWGGEVAHCAGCLSPSMGSGYFPEHGYSEAAYISGLQVLDGLEMLSEARIAIKYQNKPNCYRVTYNQTGHYFRRPHICYGGPGGTC